MNKNSKKNNGFTLIETLVVLGIFVFALGAVTSFLIYTYRAENFSVTQALAIDSARKGINGFTKEIREAIQSDSGTYLLEKCEDYEIIFYGDIDEDDNVERVRYFLENEEMKKGIINPSGSPAVYTSEEEIKTISTYVRNTTTPLFYFYDSTFSGKEEDSPLTTPVSGDSLDEITMVGIEIKVDVNPLRAPRILEIKSKIQLRNPKQNY